MSLRGSSGAMREKESYPNRWAKSPVARMLFKADALRQDITRAPDADALFGSVASELVRYLASIALTAPATVVAVGVDSKVTIPNLSMQTRLEGSWRPPTAEPRWDRRLSVNITASYRRTC